MSRCPTSLHYSNSWYTHRLNRFYHLPIAVRSAPLRLEPIEPISRRTAALPPQSRVRRRIANSTTSCITIEISRKCSTSWSPPRHKHTNLLMMSGSINAITMTCKLNTNSATSPIVWPSASEKNCSILHEATTALTKKDSSDVRRQNSPPAVASSGLIRALWGLAQIWGRLILDETNRLEHMRRSQMTIRGMARRAMVLLRLGSLLRWKSYSNGMLVDCFGAFSPNLLLALSTSTSPFSPSDIASVKGHWTDMLTLNLLFRAKI